MSRLRSTAPSWSPQAMLIPPVVVAELGAMLIAAAEGVNGGHGVTLLACAAAIATLVVIARAHMPDEAKLAQSGAIVAALLILAVSHDVFGLRRVEAAMTDAASQRTPGAASEDGANSPRPVARAEPSAAIEIRAADGGDPDGVIAALTVSVRDALPASAPRIEGLIAREEMGGVPGTAMTWSVARGGVTKRCGTLRISGTQRDIVVDRLREAILAAVAASRGGGLACF